MFAKALKRVGRTILLREHTITSGRKLRGHTATEIFGTLLRLGLRRSRLKSRDELSLWYGPRRKDEHAAKGRS